MIAPEVARRTSQGRGNATTTPILECCKPRTCQSKFKNRFRQQFLRGIPVDRYLPDFVPDRKKRQWKIEIITVNELLDMNGLGYSESKDPAFHIEQGTNDVSWEGIDNSVILDENHHRGVTFFLVKFAGKEVKSLLVAQFYREYNNCPAASKMHTLFNYVTKMTQT